MNKILGLLFAGALFAAHSSWGVEISDSLGITDGRGDGMPLHEAVTETGNTKWSASSKVSFFIENQLGFVTNGKPEPFFAKIQIPKELETVSVSADVRAVSNITVDGVSQEDAWISLGFGPESSDEPLTWPEGFFVLVNAAGRYQVVANSHGQHSSETITITRSLDIPAYDPAGFTMVKMTYDKNANTLSVWINESQVLADFDFGSRGFTPVLEATGFTGFGQMRHQAGIKNFVLTGN